MLLYIVGAQTVACRRFLAGKERAVNEVKRGTVRNVNKERYFGFIEEDGTKRSIFLHFSTYSPNYFDCGDGVVARDEKCDFNLSQTYPKNGDVVFYTAAPSTDRHGRSSWKVLSWIYSFDRDVAVAQQVRKKNLEERQGNFDPFESFFRSAGQRTKANQPPPPPPPRNKAPKTWREILGFSESERVTKESINKKYKVLAFVHHPDHGGSNDSMAEINRARAEALKYAM